MSSEYSGDPTVGAAAAVVEVQGPATSRCARVDPLDPILAGGEVQAKLSAGSADT
jgi:hypothetical protein